MAKIRLPGKLPTLPPWEALITNLHLPRFEEKDYQLQLSLIHSLSGAGANYRELFSQVCLELPAILKAECVSFVRIASGKTSVIMSNRSRKYLTVLFGRDGCKEILEDDRPLSAHLLRSTPLLRSLYLSSALISQTPERRIMMYVTQNRPISSWETQYINTIASLIGHPIRESFLQDNLETESCRLSVLTDNLLEGLAVLGPDGKILIWNKAFERLTGYSAREAIGRRLGELIHRKDNDSWADDQLKNAHDDPSRRISHEEIQIITKRNRVKWVAISLSFMRTRSGEIEQTQLFARDISKAKELEARKSEFISIATHELRTPLTAAKGYLSLVMREKDILNAKHRGYLGRAQQAIDRLVLLAEDLLRAVQVEEERLNLNWRRVDLRQLVEGLQRDFLRRSQEAGIPMRVVLPDLPAYVMADGERLRQVFANLLDNAFKYTPRGVITITVKEDTARNHQPVYLTSVADTGMGIEPREVDHIFDRFHRAHSPEETKAQGAGLGLFIAKSFIDRLNGSIRVKSRPRRGTVFTVALPAAQNHISINKKTVNNRKVQDGKK